MAGRYDDVRRAQEQQVLLASERFDETEKARDRNAKTREANGTGVHDSLARLQARAERLLARNETPADAIVKVQSEATTDRRLALERIIDASNELQSWTFLPRGARVAATVARITMLDQGRELPLGTGSLVSPRLLMTNNHVLPTREAAQDVIVELGAELDIDNQPQAASRWTVDPAGVFLTDDHLDVTLVQLMPDAQGRSAGDVYGWNRLMAQQGKIVTGEAMNVIGHPNGRLKEIAIRDNKLELILDDFLHYSTDTEPGNSGSPLFNDQWELVGLHHAGVPRKDDQGRVLRKDGQPWSQGDGDDAIDWVANEGARISRIMAWLADQPLDDDAAQVVAEIAGAAPAGPVVATPVVEAAAPQIDLTRAGTGMVPAQQGAAEATTPNGARRAVAGLRGDRDGTAYVFLHGRSQQGRDPARLRVGWTAGLNAGLTLAGRPPMDPGAIWFPFYGDRLVQALRTTESAAPVGTSPIDAAGQPAEALAPPPGDPARSVYEQLVAQASAAAGMPSSAAEDVAADESLAGLGLSVVGRLQRQLSWLSRRTGLDDVVIARVFADVAAYLGRQSVRRTVLDTVMETWPADRPVVLVSHSLGTVVAMDLIHQLGPAAQVPLLVTAGSPLAMDSVYSRLLAGGVHRPAGVGSWLNVWCSPDAVAIGCPMQPVWGPTVGSMLSDVVTDNPPERAHDIAEYLGDGRVAGRIAAAATASSLLPR